MVSHMASAQGAAGRMAASSLHHPWDGGPLGTPASGQECLPIPRLTPCSNPVLAPISQREMQGTRESTDCPKYRDVRGWNPSLSDPKAPSHLQSGWQGSLPRRLSLPWALPFTR